MPVHYTHRRAASDYGDTARYEIVAQFPGMGRADEVLGHAVSLDAAQALAHALTVAHTLLFAGTPDIVIAWRANAGTWADTLRKMASNDRREWRRRGRQL